MRTSLPLALLDIVAIVAYLVTQGGDDHSGPRQSVTVTGSFTKCESRAQQNCVVDGDTFRHGATIIRIEDIDTPETVKAQCATEAGLGHVATLRMMALLNAGPFELVHDGVRDEDKFGRKLRIVERDGKSLGTILVEEKLAHPWVGHKLPWCG